ncbi:MAG: prepilin-type N-terminal cleavage/methylation domain-containing protein [Candidatus Riflebacteria bacterium]|nr:prepilin-type N-terminal cleavage/methylation domain-containing protein [Candidatus Riflebacteria bacterium]
MISKGFSLIEILVAIMIISLAFLPLLSAFSSSHRNTRAVFEEVIASNIASEIIEALASLPLQNTMILHENEYKIDKSGDMLLDPSGIDVFRDERNAGLFPRLNFGNLPEGFRVFIEIESFPKKGIDLKDSDLIKLSVQVRWGNRNREIKLCTLKWIKG